ncbi:MAG: hypothetical protein GY750_16390 [Lentisphaerae bacterium]|nr:hypothetical protein [Lentisphaerota bacterium]MCP4102976.1 hypothetical protein [Lentisphaerota bacterium]
MKINCPHCDLKLEAGEELYGEVVECPSCHQTVAIPFSEEDRQLQIKTRCT